jgi:gamma-glutamylcyclotransferase (GGCT)/AIG2-like uncharacterized protein YtfP
MEKKDHYLFVYGTLRRNQPNHRLLQDQELVAIHTVEGFRMFSLGAFPGVQAMEGASVIGEIYAIDKECLKRCDNLEGYPYMYDRVVVPFGGSMAWMYVYCGDAKDKASIITTFDRNVAIADWVQYLHFNKEVVYGNAA